MASFVKVQTGDSKGSDSDINDMEDDEELEGNADLENDVEFDEHVESDDAEEGERDGQPGGLASVMTGILGKKKLPKKVVILAKGKTDKEIALKRRQKEEAEAPEEAKKSKLEDEELLTESDIQKLKEQRLKKNEWNEMGRVKPSALDKEIERKLQRIATRGVVQLFNAVRKQQKDIDEKLNQVGSSIRKREKVMKSVSKGAFLDMLKGTNSNVSMDASENGSKEEPNERLQAEDESTPSWNILREDFMMGASMKDWDKVSDDDSDNNHGNDDPDEDNLDSSDDDT